MTTWYVNFNGHWIASTHIGAAYWLDKGFAVCLGGTFAPEFSN